MKRRELIRLLVDKGCFLKRHGASHDVFVNTKNGKKAPVPRHPEIKESLCRLIMKQLGVSDEI